MPSAASKENCLEAHVQINPEVTENLGRTYPNGFVPSFLRVDRQFLWGLQRPRAEYCLEPRRVIHTRRQFVAMGVICSRELKYGHPEFIWNSACSHGRCQSGKVRICW
jgi:hypothetical protein